MAYDKEKAVREWHERKFRRIARAAQYASAIGSVEGDAKGFHWRIVVKGAERSKGYRSGYQRVPSYWLFLWRDGQPWLAWSKTPRALAGTIADLERELGWELKCHLLKAA